MSIQSNIDLLEEDLGEKKIAEHIARKAAEKAAEKKATNAADLAEAARRADWEVFSAARRRAMAEHVRYGNLDDREGYIQKLVNTMNEDNSSRAARYAAWAAREAQEAAREAQEAAEERALAAIEKGGGDGGGTKT
jgi:hypothetical protein